MNLIGSINKYLDELFLNPVSELDYNKDYELLISVMLSAQTTDKRVNEVGKILYTKYPSLEDLKIDSYPQEVQDEFFEAINGIPFIKSLTSPNRPRCKDLPRDSNGRVIIDITNPPAKAETARIMAVITGRIS